MPAPLRTPDSRSGLLLLVMLLVAIVLLLAIVAGDTAQSRPLWLWMLIGANLFTMAVTLVLVAGFRHALFSPRRTVGLTLQHGEVSAEVMTAETVGQPGVDASVASAHASRTQTRYARMFERTTDALMVLCKDGYTECNPACLELFGCRELSDILGLHPADLSPAEQEDGTPSSEKADEMIRYAMEHGTYRFEWLHKTFQGRVFPAEVTMVAVGEEEEPIVCAVVRDITERREAESEIRFQAYYDSLTGLPNRRLMLDRISQTLATSRRHNYCNALLFVDLDRFKLINDSVGHSVGDRLLAQIGDSLRRQIRDEDTVARFGGDEFVVLLKHLDTDREGASLKAERLGEAIQKSISRIYSVDRHSVHVTASIGIFIFPEAEETLDDIIRQADTAMYGAKERGRNQVAFFQPAMQEAVIKRLTLEKDLRCAMEADELEVYFQPLLSNERTVIGVEALARWRHPVHGFVPPDEFIAIAEDSGLIHELGEWVLVRSIEQFLALPRALSQLSVNISPHQFRHPDFVSAIEKLLGQYELPLRTLMLEITEGVFINDFDDTVERLQRLRALGVRIALDDFGTGYSSLSYLKRLPIDEIKIDRSFVMDVNRDPQDAQLVQTIIDIAHQFKLITVAEGVETEDQLNFLREQDCSIYQGYLFSRPLPAAELRSFVA